MNKEEKDSDLEGVEKADLEKKTVWDAKVIETKRFRFELNEVLGRMKDVVADNPNRTLSIRHVEDAIMRLGLQLGDLHQENPYPSSYDPSNTKIEPTAKEGSNLTKPIKYGPR